MRPLLDAPVRDRWLEDGFLVLPPGSVGDAAAAAAGLPSWADGASQGPSEADRKAERFERGGVEFAGSALTRRLWMMGLGPRQVEDPDNWLVGRRARRALPPESVAFGAELARAAGLDGRVLSAAAEASFPGHPGADEGRIRAPIAGMCADPAAVMKDGAAPVEAFVLLDDAGADGVVEVFPGTHRRWEEFARDGGGAAAPYAELLSGAGEPRRLGGPKGTVLLLHSALWRRELPAARETRRLSLVLGRPGLRPPAPPAPPANGGPSLKRRLIQWIKLNVAFPLSRRLRAPLTLVNVGAGTAWQHPFCVALDVDPQTDVNHDVAAQGLPFAGASMMGVYSSHCIEHLTPADAEGFLREALRCLAPGGTLRVVCPDMDLLFDAYDRRDAAWFDWCAGGFYAWDGWLRAIGRVASSFSVDRFSDEQLAALYREKGRRGFLDALQRRQDEDFPREALMRWPDGHKSWWTRPTLREAMRRAGFSHVTDSARHQSAVEAFRDWRYFDGSSPNMSLYVEAVK